MGEGKGNGFHLNASPDRQAMIFIWQYWYMGHKSLPKETTWILTSILWHSQCTVCFNVSVFDVILWEVTEHSSYLICVIYNHKLFFEYKHLVPVHSTRNATINMNFLLMCPHQTTPAICSSCNIIAFNISFWFLLSFFSPTIVFTPPWAHPGHSIHTEWSGCLIFHPVTRVYISQGGVNELLLK